MAGDMMDVIDGSDSDESEVLAMDRKRYHELDQRVSRSSSAVALVGGGDASAVSSGSAATLTLLEALAAKRTAHQQQSSRRSVHHDDDAKHHHHGRSRGNGAGAVLGVPATFGIAQLNGSLRGDVNVDTELFMLRERVKTLEMQNSILRLVRRPPSQLKQRPMAVSLLARLSLMRLGTRHWARWRCWAACRRASKSPLRLATLPGPPSMHHPSAAASGSALRRLNPHQQTHPAQQHSDASWGPLATPARSAAAAARGNPSSVSPPRAFLSPAATEESCSDVTCADYCEPVYERSIKADPSSPSLDLQRRVARLGLVCNDQREVIVALQRQLADVLTASASLPPVSVSGAAEGGAQCEVARQWVSSFETETRKRLEDEEDELRTAVLWPAETRLAAVSVFLLGARRLLQLAERSAMELHLAESIARTSIVDLEGPERALAASLAANRMLRLAVSRRVVGLDNDSAVPVHVDWPARPSMRAPLQPPPPQSEVRPTLPTGRGLAGDGSRREATRRMVSPTAAEALVLGPPLGVARCPSHTSTIDSIGEESSPFPQHRSPPTRSLVSPSPRRDDAVTTLHLSALSEDERVAREIAVSAFFDEYDALIEHFVTAAVAIEETQDTSTNDSFAPLADVAPELVEAMWVTSSSFVNN